MRSLYVLNKKILKRTYSLSISPPRNQIFRPSLKGPVSPNASNKRIRHKKILIRTYSLIHFLSYSLTSSNISSRMWAQKNSFLKIVEKAIFVNHFFCLERFCLVQFCSQFSKSCNIFLSFWSFSKQCLRCWVNHTNWIHVNF